MSAQEIDTTPELLSPAGNWDCARAAVAAGADAIFFGLPKFNARLRADNFTEKDLPELMDFLHRHGVKGFVTMNTLIFTAEMKAAEDQLRMVAAAGVDALIIQDLGLAKLARTVAPNVELHASTQMTITSPEGLAFIDSLFPKMERAVLSRELSLKEIEKFSAANSASHTPLEVFVHGALCVAYSGQCLTSESLGQRSANRGECAQACRLPYELVVDGEVQDMGAARYLLSPQDLAAIDLIPELIRAKVKSFKIEGRLKSPEYVTAVTRAYRKAIDAALGKTTAPVTLQDKYSLEMTFSRGLTTGWLAGTNHPYLTHGNFGKKRGPLLGEITACGDGWIQLANTSGLPVQAGDGVVFDAGENRDLEQGARIWRVEGDRLIFHKTYSGINFDRIKPGHTIYKTSDPKLESELRKFWQNAKLPEKKIPLHLIVTGAPGEPIELQCGEYSVASGTLLEQASKRPLDTETLTAQLGRLGDTRYELASLDNQLIGDCHFALSALNQLRRDLIDALESDATPNIPRLPKITTGFRDLLPSVTPHSALATPHLSVLCRTMDQVAAAIECGVDSLYCDFEDPRRAKDAVALFRSGNSDASIYLATPRILKAGETGYLKLLERAEPDGLLLRNLASLEYYKHRSDLKKIADFSLNVANPITAKLLMENAGLDHLTISYDLNIGQVLDLLKAAPAGWFELSLHQHMPMFHMEHCVFCTFLSKGTSYKDCGRPCETHVVHLRDRVGQLHRLQADVGCRNTLFNGKAQTGARFFEPLRATGLSRFRIELLDENAGTAGKTIRAYQNLIHQRTDVFSLLDEVQALEKLGVTEGTLSEY
ncbi:MAG: U32 family peptidase [Luteolibacter sp.]